MKFAETTRAAPIWETEIKMAPVIPSVDLEETYLSNYRGHKVTVQQAGTWPNFLALREKAGIEVITSQKCKERVVRVSRVSGYKILNAGSRKIFTQAPRRPRNEKLHLRPS